MWGQVGRVDLVLAANGALNGPACIGVGRAQKASVWVWLRVAVQGGLSRPRNHCAPAAMPCGVGYTPRPTKKANRIENLHPNMLLTHRRAGQSPC